MFASGGASSRVFFGSTKKKSPWKLIRSTSAIRRVIRGIYDYPKFSNLLGQQLSPDLDQVAAALARKFGWHIQVTGPSALNLLGLSTQVPGRIIYASDGPDHAFAIGKQTLEFQHTPLKEAAFKLRESALIVQGLKSLGAEQITPAIICAIRDWLEPRLSEHLTTPKKKALLSQLVAQPIIIQRNQLVKRVS